MQGPQEQLLAKGSRRSQISATRSQLQAGLEGAQAGISYTFPPAPLPVHK